MSGELPWAYYSRERLFLGFVIPGGSRLRRAVPARRRGTDRISRLPQRNAIRTGARQPRNHSLVRRRGKWLLHLPIFHASMGSYLHMRIWAVRSPQRRAAAELATDGLPIACRWAASALTRGTVWSATAHELTVRHVNGSLKIDET